MQTKYNCSGDVYSGPTEMNISGSSVGCDAVPNVCGYLKNNCDTQEACVAAGGCCNTYTVGSVDLRTEAQKAAGCCPADLI